MTRFSLLTLASRLRLAAIALLLSIGMPALAQQNAPPPITPSHQTVATDVLKASGMMTMFENSIPNVLAGLRQQFTRQRPELARDIEASLSEIEKQIPEIASDGVAVAARFLAVRMSEAELQEVKTFMNSPAGKKYVQVLPAFMEDVVPFLEQWNVAAGDAISRGFRAEMQKRGHNL
jgi:uncharacterized protein